MVAVSVLTSIRVCYCPKESQCVLYTGSPIMVVGFYYHIYPRFGPTCSYAQFGIEVKIEFGIRFCIELNQLKETGIHGPNLQHYDIAEIMEHGGKINGNEPCGPIQDLYMGQPRFNGE